MEYHSQNLQRNLERKVGLIDNRVSMEWSKGVDKELKVLEEKLGATACREWRPILTCFSMRALSAERRRGAFSKIHDRLETIMGGLRLILG